MQVDVNPAREPSVLALEHRWAIADTDRRHITQANLCTTVGEHRQIAQLLHGIADLARIAHVDREALQPLDGLTDVVTADRRRDDALHIGDVEPIASRSVAIDLYIDIAAAGEAFGKRRAHTRHLLDRTLDLAGHAVNLLQARARHLHAHGTFDTRRQHVDAIANGWYPDVRQARNLHALIQLLDELVRGHAGTPLIARFELDCGLEHFQGRRIGRRFGPSGLTEYALHLGYRLDEAVGLLQQLRNLACSNAGERRGHIEQVALIERRQEFPAAVRGGVERHEQDHERRPQYRLGVDQYAGEHRLVERDEPAVDRIAFLIRNPPADQIAHQHRNQRDRKSRRGGHGVGLGERERREHPAFLRFEREHRHE